MLKSILAPMALAIGAATLTFASVSPVDAATRCKRVTKTGGAAIGAVGGAVLGKVILGGTGGTLAGAAAGGVAGHEIARKKYNRNCGRRARR